MPSRRHVHTRYVGNAAGLHGDELHRRFGFAGFSGIGLLALGIYGLTVVPASAIGLVLLVAGVLLLVWDVQLRRIRWPSGVGVVAFLIGSVLAYGDVAPAIALSPSLIGVATLMTVLYYGFVLTVALQSRDRITTTQQGLVGLVGETRTDLRPEGGVYVKGTMWRGKSVEGTSMAGTRVRVRGLDGLVLRVEPVPQETQMSTDTEGESQA